MNSNVCLLPLMFFCLENIAGFITDSSPGKETRHKRDTSIQQEESSKKKRPEFEHDEGTSLDLICDSEPLQHYHQWSQRYQWRKEPTGKIPLQEGVNKTHYNIIVEKFDNNTRIYCVSTKEKDTEKKKHNGPVADVVGLIPSAKDFITKIIVTNGSFKPIQEPGTTNLTYSKTKDVSFSCEEYVNRTQYLGVIDTSNNITILEQKSVWTHNMFNETHNGTILCCIYYEVNGTVHGEEKWITRYVTNKTILIYDDDIWYDALDFTEVISNSTRSNPDDTDPENQDIIIYSAAAVAVVFILLVIIVIFYIKRCRKKPKADNKVQYVDLDILRPGTFQRPVPEEESPYAEIIGVMRPA